MFKAGFYLFCSQVLSVMGFLWFGQCFKTLLSEVELSESAVCQERLQGPGTPGDALPLTWLGLPAQWYGTLVNYGVSPRRTGRQARAKGWLSR